jgi:hypothetical protein
MRIDDKWTDPGTWTKGGYRLLRNWVNLGGARYPTSGSRSGIEDSAVLGTASPPNKVPPSHPPFPELQGIELPVDTET